MLSALLSFRGVLLFWIIYGIAHAGLRLSVSRTLTIDDARANELTQGLAFGYQIRQPPLYEWVLWSVQQVLGTGIESHLFVRYALIALIGVTTFGAVRAAVKDDRWAAAASLSLIFAYPVSWTFHEWATQTLLLCAGCMMTIHAATLFLEKGNARNATLLGGALAFGLYAKFSFPLMAGGLLLAALSLPETRSRLANPRLLLALAIPLVVLSPYTLWVLQVQGDVVTDLQGHLVNSPQSHLARAAYGLWRLVTSVVTFLLPWLVFAGLIAPPAFWHSSSTVSPPSFAERLAWRTMVLAVALAAIGIVLSGATNIAARYMHPILFVAPVYVFARMARYGAEPVKLRQFAVMALIGALVIFGVRFVSFTNNPFSRQAQRALLLPYEDLAAAFKQRGLDRGTVASVSVRDAGNLRAFLPALRVAAFDSLRMELPPGREPGAPCTLVWRAREESAAQRLATTADAAAERIDIPASQGLIAMRGESWFVARLDPNSPVCR